MQETYEVLEAIDRGDPEALCQELGDLLLQVVFHAQLAAEAGRFDIADVIGGLREKLVARHPHIFGDKSLATAEQVVAQWECLKQQERGEGARGALGDIPAGLPALARAQMALRAAARESLVHSAKEAHNALEAALARLGEGPVRGPEVEEAMGELLFAAVELARACGVDAEQALRGRVDRFIAVSRSGGGVADG